MRKFLAGFVSGSALVLAFSAVLASKANAIEEGEDAETKVLRHLVLYEFKPEVTAAERQEVIDTFAALPSKIDTILDFEHGENISKEGKSDGLTYGFVVTFRDEAGLQTYLKHPAHLAYVEVVRDRRQKVVVFDYWAAN